MTKGTPPYIAVYGTDAITRTASQIRRAGSVATKNSAANNYTAEVVRVFSEAYMRTRDRQSRNRVDGLYGAMWGKAGYGGPQTTGQYAYDCATPTRGKYFGFCFGVGAAQAWPAARTK